MTATQSHINSDNSDCCSATSPCETGVQNLTKATFKGFRKSLGCLVTSLLLNHPISQALTNSACSFGCGSTTSAGMGSRLPHPRPPVTRTGVCTTGLPQTPALDKTRKDRSFVRKLGEVCFLQLSHSVLPGPP